VFVNVSVIVNPVPDPLPVPADPVIVPAVTVDVQVKLLATVAFVVMLALVPLHIADDAAAEVTTGIGLTVTSTVSTDTRVLQLPPWDTPLMIYLIVAAVALLVFVNVSVIVNPVPAPLPVPADPVIVPVVTVDVHVKLLATVDVVLIVAAVPLHIADDAAAEVTTGIGLTVISTVSTDTSVLQLPP